MPPVGDTRGVCADMARATLEADREALDTMDGDTVERHGEFTYLRAAIITLGVAAGIAAVAVWGRFDTTVNTVLSLTIFPLVLAAAFFLVFLTVALLRDRYASAKSLIVLLLLTALLLLFPFLYTPRAPVEEQVQRLALIPLLIALAVLIGYFVVRWLDGREELEAPQAA